jgi:aspartyl-tRNA(Asn)/glutamyl-tRNA(Gln) amidotransferase subunit B
MSETKSTVKSLTKTIANIITGNLLGQATKLNRDVDTLVSKENLIELAKLFDDSKLNNQGVAKAIDLLINNPKEELNTILNQRNLLQITDTGALVGYVNTIIDQNPEKVAQYKEGKVQLIGFFVGQCMKISGGNGNPKVFNELITEKLK